MTVAKVSVIIPIYNVKPYVGQCLESVTNQTLGEIEIICVDDRGTDGSMDVVHHYAERDSRIKIITNPKNLGPGGARNTGLSFATGELVCYIDADDWISLDKLEKESSILSNSEYDSVWCNYYVFDDAAATATESSYDCSGGIDPANGGVTSVTITQSNMHRYQPGPWNKMFRTSFIKKYAPVFVEGTKCGEDLPLYFMLCIKSPKVLVINEPLYWYRQHGDSLMGNVRGGIGRCEDLIAAFKKCHVLLATAEDGSGAKTMLLQFIESFSYPYLYSKQYKKEMFLSLQRFLPTIGFPEDFDTIPRDLAYVFSGTFNDVYPYLYGVLSLANKINPCSTLRRRYREWIRVNCYTYKS